METRCETESTQFKYKILSGLQNWQFFFFLLFSTLHLNILYGRHQEIVYPIQKVTCFREKYMNRFLEKQTAAGKHLWVTALEKRAWSKFFLRTKQNHCLSSHLLCRGGVVPDLSPNSYPRTIGMFLNQLVSTLLYFTEVRRKGERSSKTQSKHYLIQQFMCRLFSPSDVNPHQTMQQFCEYFKFCLTVPVTRATLLFLWSFILTDLVWIMSNTWTLFTVWLQSISLLEWALSFQISNTWGMLNYCYKISAISA